MRIDGMEFTNHNHSEGSQVSAATLGWGFGDWPPRGPITTMDLTAPLQKLRQQSIIVGPRPNEVNRSGQGAGSDPAHRLS